MKSSKFLLFFVIVVFSISAEAHTKVNSLQQLDAALTQLTAKVSPAVVQIVGGITELTKMLKAVYPPAAPQANEIQNQLQQVQQSMMQTQSPDQTQAPPI